MGCRDSGRSCCVPSRSKVGIKAVVSAAIRSAAHFINVYCNSVSDKKVRSSGLLFRTAMVSLMVPSTVILKR